MFHVKHPIAQPTIGQDEILAAMECLLSKNTTMGAVVDEFEREFAQKIGSRHAIMVTSGSTADLLASFALVNPENPILQPGDEVLVPAVTWPTQVWSLIMAGLKVRLADVDPNTLNVTAQTLLDARTEATKAVFLVHTLGNPCDLDAIFYVCDRYRWALLEDACEAMFSRYADEFLGSWGLMGTFSFFFSHHLTTMEGGMVVTDDAELAAHLRLLRNHGWDKSAKAPFTFETWGFNARPTEVQAAIGLAQLVKADEWVAIRKALSEQFYGQMRTLTEPYDLRLPRVVAGAEPCWMALPLMVPETAPYTRAELLAYLAEEGIESRSIIGGNFARSKAARLFRDRGLSWGELPGADAIHARGFYIGMPSVFQEARAVAGEIPWPEDVYHASEELYRWRNHFYGQYRNGRDLPPANHSV